MRNKAFTLIELLIVVSIIGILASVLISVINYKQKKAIAEDAVKKSNIEKISESIESYYAMESKYPEVDSGLPKGLGDGTSAINTYINKWPGIAGQYVYQTDGTSFAVYVESAENPGYYFKYSSVWEQIETCTKVTDVSSCL